MAFELKLRKIGSAVGLVLPKEVLAHLKVDKGDIVTLTESQEGIRLTASTTAFTKTMSVFESLNRRYRSTLGELAR